MIPEILSKKILLLLGLVALVSVIVYVSRLGTVTSQDHSAPEYDHHLMIHDRKIKTYRSPASVSADLRFRSKPRDYGGKDSGREETADVEAIESQLPQNAGKKYESPGFVDRTVPEASGNTSLSLSSAKAGSEKSAKATGPVYQITNSPRPVSATGGNSTPTIGNDGTSSASGETAPAKRPTIKGLILPLEGVIAYQRPGLFIDSAYAATCTQPRILLMDLTNYSVLLDNPVSEADLDSDAAFEFNPTSLGLNLSTPNRYLLQTKGCSVTYQRIISSFYEDQSIDQSTTLLSKIINTAQAGVVPVVPAFSMHSLYLQIQEGLDDGHSMEDVWSMVDLSPVLKQSFQETFQGTSTEELKIAAPDIVDLDHFKNLSEKASYPFQVTATHWYGSYVIGYEWQLNGTIQSTNPNWSFTPSANSPAQQTVTLILGHKNSGDALVDRSKPYHRIDFQVNIADTFPVSSPVVRLAGGSSDPVSSTSLSLETLTGVLSAGVYSGCETFSDFAITETSSAPAAGDFVYSCLTGPLDPLTYTLQNSSDGAKALRIWARDARGNITATPSLSMIVLDSTAPVIAFHNLQANYEADTNATFFWKLTEAHSSASQFFDVEFFDGSTWSALPQVPVTNGPHAAVVFSTTLALPNTAITGARIRVTYEDTLGQQTIATSNTFNVLRPVLGSTPTSLDLGSVANKSTSPEVSISITNTGPVTSKMCTGTYVGGTHGTDFVLFDDDCVGTTIAAGGSCALKFKVTPSAKGSRSGDFTINCGNDSYTTALSATSLNNIPLVTATPAVTTTEETAVTTTLGQITDLDGDSLTYSIVAGPANGALSACAVAGSEYRCTYTPDLDFIGTDTFTFKANDGTADSVVTTFTVTVTNANDAPVLTATQSVSTAEETLVNFNLNSATDVDGNTLTYAIVSAPASGTLSCTGVACAFTPAADFTGNVSFTYKANDGTADSNVATVTVSVSNVNDAPVVGADQSVAVTEDTPENFSLNSGSDIDLPAQTLSYKLISAPTKGVLSNCITTAGYSTDLTCTYTPATNETGTDSFTYRVYDGTVESSFAATVTLTISGANDAPTLAATQSVSTAEDTALTFDLAAGSDTENDPLTYVKLTNPASGSLTCAGGTDRSCTYTPAANYNGSVTFTYKANDGSADSNTSTVTITVTPVNDLPVMAADQTFSIDDSTTLSITLSPGTDIDGDSLTYKIVSLPTGGTLSNCISTGAYGNDLTCDYISSANFNATDSFTFVAYDGSGEAATPATVSITVNDNTPAPAPALTLASNQYTNSTATSFTASACTDTPELFVNEGSQPSSGAAGWQTCSTIAGAITFTLSTSQGAHTVRIWAKDSLGNVSTTSSDFTIYYDTVLPALSLVTPSAVRGGAAFNLAWSATESYTTTSLNFTVEAFDGTSWSTVGTTASTAGPLSATAFTRSWNVPAVNVSTAAFRVSFTDRAGNSNTVTSGNFEIDSTPPATTITSPADNSYHLSSATITGACEAGRSVTFSGGIQSTFSIACATGSYSQLVNFSNSDGNKTVFVSQSDAVGNSTTVSVNLIRDEVAPVMTKTIGASPFFTNGDTPNAWGGTCEGNYTIYVTGDQITNFNCSGGSWSWTPAAKTTDGTFTYNLVQTDGAGNTSAPPLELSWERDATPPLFEISSPLTASRGDNASITNNLNTMTLSGACEGTNTIAISGGITETVSCSSGSWEYALPSYSTDGTRNFTFTQSDSAGNTSVIALAWTRDTTGPALKIATNLRKSNENTVTFSGTCEPGVDVVVSGPESQTIPCPAGAWTFISSSYGSDASRTFTFTQTFTVAPFNSTAISARWIRETDLPTLTAFTTSAGNPSRSSFIPVNISATSQNPDVAVSHICIKSDVTAQPALNNSCFIGVNSPEIGKPLGQTLSITNYFTLMGWTPKSYNIHIWVKDEAGNISILTESTGTDRIIMTYDPGIAPTIWDVLAANTPSAPLPPSRAQSVSPAGTDVFIRWNASDNDPLPNGSVSLYYTTDEITFNLIASGLNNDDYGCGIGLGATQGCYRWVGGSPLNTAYKIRVRVTDSTAVSSQLTSNPVNYDMIKIIAGNTESGLDGSAQTAMFFTKRHGDYSDPNTLVVSKDGQFFFADHKRGILTIDQDDGKQKLYIRATGVSTGDGGPAVNATLNYAVKIALDYQNRLLIIDQNRIRRVDLRQTIPTIETIIGGGADTGDTVANPLALSMSTYDPNDWWMAHGPLLPLPNGDIIFRSEYGWKEWNVTSYRMRIYKASSNSVVSRYYTGVGNTFDPAQDVMKCRLTNPGFEFNPANSQITRVSLLSWYDVSFPECTRSHNFSRVLYNPSTFQTIPNSDNSYVWWHFPNYTGMDGKTYITMGRGYVVRNDWDGNYPRLLGTGPRGECEDGVAGPACMVDIQNLFVTTIGKMYFTDRGVIRTIDESGLVKTLFGQKLTYGHNVNALNARLSDVTRAYQINNGKIIANDRGGNYMKEFQTEGNISIIAGDGSAREPNIAQPAASQPVLESEYVIPDKATGSLYGWYQSHGYGSILKLNRTNGMWEHIIGNIIGTGTTTYQNGDGQPGLDIIANNGDLTRSIPMAFDNNKLIVNYMSHNGPAERWQDMMGKIFDAADSYRMSHLIGTTGYHPTDDRFLCDATTPTPAAGCMYPHWDTIRDFQWDSTGNRWITARVWTGSENQIFDIVPGGNIHLIYTTQNAIHDSFLFRRESGDEIIYYCNGSRIRRANINTSTETELAWSMPNLSCRGTRMDYNATNNSIIFPFEQNGLNGVAEYFLP